MTKSFALVRLILHFLANKKRASFIKACQDPENAQRLVKEKILSKVIGTFPDKPLDYKYYESRKYLSHEPVEFFETTSGSTGIKKRIPYTKSLLHSYENMFLLWAHDVIFHSSLKLKTGKVFISVSPRIGADTDDRKYLSPFTRFLLTPFLASNPDDHTAETGEEFLTKISEDLKNQKELEIISIWSPTYLLSLLEFMNIKETKKIWPELKLISCWTHAQAEIPSKILRDKFPGITLQPKGLLSTEAPVTIPWSEANGCVPLLTETYIELLNNGKLIPLHEARPDITYTVITSQSNGYLRYNTHDQVQVTGYYFKTPVLKFVGRTGIHCDLAGEKLSEEILRELFSDIKSPALFVPDTGSSPVGYRVFHNSDFQEWESRLTTIYHYHLARELRQLAPAKVCKVTNLSSLYLKFYQQQGMNLGDIKERLLLSDLNLAQKFLAWIDKELPSSH